MTTVHDEPWRKVGCFKKPLGAVQRIGIGLAGAMLLFQGLVTALIGAGLLVILLGLERIRTRPSPQT